MRKVRMKVEGGNTLEQAKFVQVSIGCRRHQIVGSFNGCGAEPFFFSSRRRHTRWTGDWSSDVCSSDLMRGLPGTEALRVTERFSRPKIGHMDIEVTIDD